MLRDSGQLFLKNIEQYRKFIVLTFVVLPRFDPFALRLSSLEIFKKSKRFFFLSRITP